MGFHSKENGYHVNNGSINNGYLATETPSGNGVVTSGVKNKYSINIDTEQPISNENESEVGEEEEKAAPPHYTVKNTLLGCLVTTLASLFLAIGQGCIQLLDGAVGDFQLAAMRTFFQGSMGATFYIYKRRLPRIPRNRWIWTLLYSSCAVSVNVTFSIGLRYIPAGAAACIRRVVDLLLVTIVTITFLREALTVIKAFSVTLCLIGVTMLIQPWYTAADGDLVASNNTLALALFPPGGNLQMFPYMDSTYGSSGDENSTTTDPGEDGEGGLGGDIIGYILVGVAGILSGCATLNQKYNLPKLNTWTLNLCTGVLGFVVTSIISLITEDLTFPSEADKIILVIVQAITWGTAATLRVKGVTLAPAVLMTVVMAMQIVFLLIGQYTVLSTIQPGVGNWVEITGAVLVIVAIITPPIYQIIQSKQTAVSRKRAPSCSNIEFAVPEDPKTDDINM